MPVSLLTSTMQPTKADAVNTNGQPDSRESLGAPQKLTTSTRIDLMTPKTDRATWHGDGRYLPHSRRRRVSR